MPSRRLAKISACTPLLILFYFALQLAVRLSLSPNLEVDDAEMVGQIGWAWGYPNSHPPVFHWLVRLCHEAFENWPAATAVPKFALLALGYLLIYDAARRASGSAIAGALAVAALFFIPVVAWKTEAKLTHSILGFTATAATMHALILLLTGARWWMFVWLGFAAAIGLLAKYNFVLVLIAALIAIASVTELRRALKRPAALLALLVFAALITPHLLWIRSHMNEAAERAYMLKTGGGPLGMNLSAQSTGDGLVSLLLVLLVSVLPALAIFGLAHWRSPKSESETTGTNATQATARRALGIVVFAELALLVLTVVVAGIYQVHERYLLLLLPPFALWVALRFSLVRQARGAALVLATAFLLAVAITAARPLSVRRGDSRLAWPYVGMAEEIRSLIAGPIALLGDRPENAANLAIRIPEAVIFNRAEKPPKVLLVADAAQSLPQMAERLGTAYAPAGDVRVVTRPLRWRPECNVSLAVQRWKRLD